MLDVTGALLVIGQLVVGRQITHRAVAMKDSSIRAITMILVQPFAMYLFLRVLECGFFVSAGLAAVAAGLVGFGVYLIQTRIAGRRNSL